MESLYISFVQISISKNVPMTCDCFCSLGSQMHFSFDHRNKLHFPTDSHRKQLIYIVIIIFHYFYCIYDWTHAA